MEKFLAKYGLFIAALIAVLGIMSFFFLKPQNLVPEKCSIQGFGCNGVELSQEKGRLSLALSNGAEKGVVLKSITATSTDAGIKDSGIECRKEFSDIWQFATGKHMAQGETAEIILECTGVSSNLVHSGNIRLAVNLLWHPDDTSEAGARKTAGEIITDIRP
ncbi:hypothetical protein HYV82_00060 [Candidatus Woesearchaeota archaeon]|nr:hypothetical protein [Candidatus Woesearchaeota archaeon]